MSCRTRPLPPLEQNGCGGVVAESQWMDGPEGVAHLKHASERFHQRLCSGMLHPIQLGTVTLACCAMDWLWLAAKPSSAIAAPSRRQAASASRRAVVFRSPHTAHRGNVFLNILLVFLHSSFSEIFQTLKDLNIGKDSNTFRHGKQCPISSRDSSRSSSQPNIKKKSKHYPDSLPSSKKKRRFPPYWLCFTLASSSFARI